MRSKWRSPVRMKNLAALSSCRQPDTAICLYAESNGSTKTMIGYGPEPMRAALLTSFHSLPFILPYPKGRTPPVCGRVHVGSVGCSVAFAKTEEKRWNPLRLGDEVFAIVRERDSTFASTDASHSRKISICRALFAAKMAVAT